MNNVAKEDVLKQTIENLQKDGTSAIGFVEADHLLHQAYQTAMGIFDYVETSDPFKIVVAHDNEDTFLTSRRARRIQEYYHASVFDVMHLNWSQFQRLPVPEADQAIAMSRKIKRVQSENQMLALSSTQPQ